MKIGIGGTHRNVRPPKNAALCWKRNASLRWVLTCFPASPVLTVVGPVGDATLSDPRLHPQRSAIRSASTLKRRKDRGRLASWEGKGSDRRAGPEANAASWRRWTDGWPSLLF